MNMLEIFYRQICLLLWDSIGLFWVEDYFHRTQSGVENLGFERDSIKLWKKRVTSHRDSIGKTPSDLFPPFSHKILKTTRK